MKLRGYPRACEVNNLLLRGGNNQQVSAYLDLIVLLVCLLRTAFRQTEEYINYHNKYKVERRGGGVGRERGRKREGGRQNIEWEDVWHRTLRCRVQDPQNAQIKLLHCVPLCIHALGPLCK